MDKLVDLCCNKNEKKKKDKSTSVSAGASAQPVAESPKPTPPKRGSSCWADTRKTKPVTQLLGPHHLQITDLRRGSCDPAEVMLSAPTHRVPTHRQAFVTLATNDTYALGCLVLAESLRRVNTKKELVVMVTRHVSDPMRSVSEINLGLFIEFGRKSLKRVFDSVRLFDVLDSADLASLVLLQRPELGVTLTKLHCWTLTEFDKAVFLDADTMVVRNCDEMFDLYDGFCAAPDIGWPDCFNSGVFVYVPCRTLHKKMLEFASKFGSFDGGDQGLLNRFFHEWARGNICHHLPFTYNMVASIIYTYRPAYKEFGAQIKIVHFLGPTKPWHHDFDIRQNKLYPLNALHKDTVDLLVLWWHIFVSRVMPIAELGFTGAAGEITEKYRHALADHEEPPYYVDYRGVDAYDMIQEYVTARIQS